MADQKYIVLSPDGFPIERDVEYNSLAEVQEAIEKFVAKYEKQGYYSQSITKVTKIPLNEIEANCRLVKL